MSGVTRPAAGRPAAVGLPARPARRGVRAAPARRDRREGRLAELRRPRHLRGLPGGVLAEPAHVGRQHARLHRAGRADGDGARAVGLPLPRRAALAGPAAARAAAGRRRPRAALHLRPPRAARRVARRARRPDRLLDDRGRDGADVRGPAVPRRQPRGRAAHRRRPLRGRRRLARRLADHRVPPDHAAPGACPAWSPARCSPSPASLGEFGATITFAGSLQGRTRTLPLEIYLQRETDPDAAVALALVLLVVAVVVIGFARQGRGAL